MDNILKEIGPLELQDNVFELVGSDWMLITAGSMESCNTMTASWGGFGVLWGKKVSFCFVRPSRYTYGFMENSDFYSLSFFDDEYKDALKLCGAKSGRDMDKITAAGLTKVWNNKGAVCFNEARLSIVCQKLYFQDFKPENYLDPRIMKNYPNGDHHRMYVGEIVSIAQK